MDAHQSGFFGHFFLTLTRYKSAKFSKYPKIVLLAFFFIIEAFRVNFDIFFIFKRKHPFYKNRLFFSVLSGIATESVSGSAYKKCFRAESVSGQKHKFRAFFKKNFESVLGFGHQICHFSGNTFKNTI